jgi:primosomal protein N' (replication factor Y)
MDLAIGHMVQVQFGRQKVAGYVVGLAEATDLKRVRPVHALMDPKPGFNTDQLAFFRWMAEYYLSGLGEVIATALPSRYRARVRRVYIPSPAGIEALAAEDLGDEPAVQVLREVVARPGRTRGGVARVLHQELEAKAVARCLQQLVRKEWVIVEERQPPERSGKVRTVKLLVPCDAVPMEGGIRMRGVLARLAEAGGTMDIADLVQLEGNAAQSAVRRLVEKGLVERGDREDRSASAKQELLDTAPPPTLNPDQKRAVAAVKAMGKGTALLHGVTGSGKTEVYLRLSKAVLETGRQVLVLVPEIALTPQLVGRFRARFGDRIAVLHSGLTQVERLREWRRIRAGEADVAVGARSALFAPFRSLGLIVVDEEHDDSYKQEDGVRYHARDLAVVRGALAACPVLLGSATPSMETWQNAQEGRYVRIPLPKRATPKALPSFELVDMRGRKPGNPLSGELIEGITQCLANGGQAIVLYNRRGYAPVVECPGCGGTFSCPSCGVGSLVYHQRQGRMSCHYCGFRREFKERCTGCDTKLVVLGYGTERVEEALQQAFPDVPISRMDADTTRGRGAHHRILSHFREGKSRLLVGTQLVAKGHDFPGVQLSAVVGVDHILMMPDFRSAERTHALVTQLAGRAGRGEVVGRVIIQTRHPDHFVFQQLDNRQDMDTFYRLEARQRQILAHPPFSRIVILRVESTDLNRAQEAGVALVKQLRQPADGHSIQVFGPVLAPRSKLVGRWRFQIVLRGRDVPRFRAYIRQVRDILLARPAPRTRVIVDVDPRSLL